MRRLLSVSLVAFACLGSFARAADEYPSRAVRVIVPFAPCGGTEVVARRALLALVTAFRE